MSIERYFGGLDRFSNFLERQAVEHEASVLAAADVSVHVLHRKIEKVFGDNTKLQDLAPATQTERLRLGYSENDPLVRKGDLRDSYKEAREGLTVGVGSSDPVAGYQEFGTATIPARPTVEIGLHESADEILAIVEAAAGAALGMGSASSELEILSGVTGLVP
jgi:hypothetical protein